MKNMEEAIDEILFDKKSSVKKREKITQEEEKENDVKSIIQEVELDDLEDEDEDTDDEAEETDDESDEDDEDDEDEKEPVKAKVTSRKPKGAKVLEVSLTIDGEEQGILEVGAEEYGTITDISALLDLYEIDSKDLVDPEREVKSFVISVQEYATQTGNNSLSMMMQMNKDETISINILVNEIGQTFNDLAQAVGYFNTQYQQNILDIVNKEIK